ncbi:hypothetical protein S83_055790, partial [Arachis hypogaea]
EGEDIVAVVMFGNDRDQCSSLNYLVCSMLLPLYLASSLYFAILLSNHVMCQKC